MKRFLFLLVILLFPMIGWAQVLTLPITPSTVTGAESPRVLIKQFLDAMQGGDPDAARRCLDLRDINFALRDTEGVRRAKLLYSILNRTEGFSPDKISDKTTGPIATIPIRLRGAKSAIGSIAIVPISDRNWLVSSDTVASLTGYWEQVRDQIPINGYTTDYELELDPYQQLRGRVPQALWAEIFFLEIWQWIGLAILLAVSWFIGFLLRVAIIRPLRKRLSADSLATLKRLKRGIGWLAACSIWGAALPYFDLPHAMAVVVVLALKIVGALSVLMLGGAILDIFFDTASNRASSLVRRGDSIFFPIARKFAQFVLYSVILLGLLASLDVNVTGMVAGLGIGGLVVALAAKDSVENVFGSLTILFDMPFGIGDWIKIGEVSGVVEEINLRSTRIRTFADSVITVPNSNLTKAAVENFGARRQRRIDLSVGVSHANGLASAVALCDRVREWMVANPKIRADNAYAYVAGITDTSLTLVVQGYILTNELREELEIRQELVVAMTEAAEACGVELGPHNWPMALLPKKP